MTKKIETLEIKLTQSEKVIVDRYQAESELKKLNAKAIFKLCESGKKGHKSLIRIAQYMKANGDSVNALKTQISRAMNSLKTGLSLQGIGEKQKITEITIAPKQDQVGGSAKAKAQAEAKAKAEAEAKAVKKITTEVVWDYVIKRFTRDDLEALVADYNKAHKTKLKLAS